MAKLVHLERGELLGVRAIWAIRHKSGVFVVVFVGRRQPFDLRHEIKNRNKPEDVVGTFAQLLVRI